jgi:hypothetical protein
MGHFKDQDIERAQAKFNEEEAERIAAAYRQPTLSRDFSDYPEADSLLDFVKVYNARKAAFREKNLRYPKAN